MTDKLKDAKRIVIKCGSALFIDSNGQIREEWLSTLAKDIANLKTSGKEILIVTSGAVALGRKILSLQNSKLNIEEKQAAAAIGQVELMQVWQNALGKEEIICAQTLLTAYDTERWRNWLNARDTFEALFNMGVVPIVNENDTIATEEIKYGDNDRLSARVAQMIGADILILLSDINGLYTSNPKTDNNAKHIPIVSVITPEIENMAGGADLSGVGTGGMHTKIEAAKIATSAGTIVSISSGLENNPLSKLVINTKKGNSGNTVFTTNSDIKSSQNAWLANNIKPQGTFIIDDGALKALNKGGSLLPVGVKTIEGAFERGDAVIIKSLKGDIIARGISAYSSNDAAKIIGKQSSEIESILGFEGRPALIHRDYMVMG